MKRLARFLPKSLAGQIALLVAVALFVAQAINFGLLLRERQAARFAQVIVPTVTRLSDASDRLLIARSALPGTIQIPRGGYISDPRTRVQLHGANPLDPAPNRRTDLEATIRKGLEESGIHVGQLIAVVRPFRLDDRVAREIGQRRADRLRRARSELAVAVELPGKGWLAVGSPWPRTEVGLVSQLIAQTLILYLVVLVPVLLAGRRIARPLRTLGEAVRSFKPGDGTPPLPEQGTGEVRSVIGAYNALSRRVNAMLDEKDRMLGAIGHDLRTPLQALRVRIESVEDEDDRARMADTIDEMSRTLDDILSLARLGRPSEKMTDVDLSALVDAVVEDFRDLDHQVTFEEAPRLLMHLRPTLMRRAVRNLIENAVKYGGGAEVLLVPLEGSVEVRVCDRGPGIPADKIDAVFDPFIRLEESRNRETGGAGLGLALARAIVHDAGCSISLANREGGGLTATISLPRS